MNHSFRSSLALLFGVAGSFAAACTTGDVTLGEGALAADGGAPNGGDGGAAEASNADGGECRPIPPITPDACPNARVHDRLDANGCWLGFDCVPIADDAAAADAGPACPSGRGQCVGLSPSGCPDGVFAPADVASCGGGVGVACCVSCPQVVQAVCPPDRQLVRASKDIYGCTVGYQCYAAFALGDADSGQTVHAKTHDDLDVTLTTNASTGHVWSVSQAGGLPAPVESSTAGPNPGDDGTHTFSWSDLPAGNFAVTLIYKRPFETTPTATFTFTADVAP
jgi:predicted secreted protein